MPSNVITVETGNGICIENWELTLTTLCCVLSNHSRNTAHALQYRGKLATPASRDRILSHMPQDRHHTTDYGMLTHTLQLYSPFKAATHARTHTQMKLN